MYEPRLGSDEWNRNEKDKSNQELSFFVQKKQEEENMQSFSKKEILQYFEDLNQMLASHNQTGELLICGGASMALLYDETIRTQDIDGYILSESVKQDILNYAAVIQEEYGLSSNWFNESAKGFINRNWPQDTIETYSNLTVKSVPAEQLLAMKLSSARPYSRDQEDAIRLMDYLGIQTQEEVFQILENNLQEPVLLPKVQYFAQETFQQYQTKEVCRKDAPMPEQTGAVIGRYTAEIQKACQMARRIVNENQRTEFPSFVEERERRKQASFAGKENRQGISSELERDKDDFTRSR